MSGLEARFPYYVAMIEAGSGSFHPLLFLNCFRPSTISSDCLTQNGCGGVPLPFFDPLLKNLFLVPVTSQPLRAFRRTIFPRFCMRRREDPRCSSPFVKRFLYSFFLAVFWPSFCSKLLILILVGSLSVSRIQGPGHVFFFSQIDIVGSGDFLNIFCLHYGRRFASKTLFFYRSFQQPLGILPFL